MTQQKVQLDDSDPLEEVTSSLSQVTLNVTMKAKKDSYNQKNSAKKNNIKNNNTVTQLKIPPYKKDSRKLFVGGLPAGLTGDEFRGIFEKFGTILDSVVIIDRTTKRSRGFGFVTFEDAKVAQKLLNSGKASNDSASNSVSHCGCIFIRGKRCEIKASEPKEMNSSSNSLEQPVQGTSNGESPSNHGGTSFDRPLSPNHYSTPLHPYSYEVPRQILHHGNGYQFYPNSGREETDDNEHYSVPDGTYNNVNPCDEVFANGDHVASYTEQFGVDVNRNGMMAYQNELLYSPQPFVYDNCVPYTHQMMLPHAPAYGSVYPMPITWHHPVDYSTQNEYAENSAPISERS